jgi:hypothetical protein
LKPKNDYGISIALLHSACVRQDEINARLSAFLRSLPRIDGIGRETPLAAAVLIPPTGDPRITRGSVRLRNAWPRARYHPRMRSIFALRLLPALAALHFSFACAQGAGPAPGEYIGTHGSGKLNIAAPAGGGQKFTLQSYGANGHSCDLDGVIHGRQARVDTEKGMAACVIDFTAKGADLDVVSKTDDACRFFCGARAAFDGAYLQPPPGCKTVEMKKTRAAFKQAYDKKDYAQARATLAPLLGTCKTILDDFDESRIRNDLAVALYHQGDLAECRKVLEPLRELAAMNDKKIDEGYPPSDADTYKPIARAARTNLRLCQGSAK